MIVVFFGRPAMRAPDLAALEKAMEIQQLKLLAEQIRNFLLRSDQVIGHNQALDLAAALPGLRNWPEVKAFPACVMSTELDDASAARLAARLNKRFGLDVSSQALLKVLSGSGANMDSRSAEQNLRSVISTAFNDVVQGLSDRDIVRLAAADIGIAYFPEVEKGFVSQNFTDAYWHDGGVQQYWCSRHGRGVRSFAPLVTPKEFASMDFELLFLTEADDPDAFENAFEENLSDPAWVSKLATAWRTAMLSATSMDLEIAYVIDGWQEVLDSLSERESE